MTDYHLITAAIATVCAFGVAATAWPDIGTGLAVVLLGAAGLAVAGYWLREAGRELRHRLDMHALDVGHTPGTVTARPPADHREVST